MKDYLDLFSMVYFDADGGDGDGGEPSDPPGTDGGEGQDGDPPQTFTQDQVNEFNKKAREKGKRQAMKELQADLDELEELRKKGKSQDELLSSENEELKTKLTVIESRADIAEAKVTAYEAGVSKENLNRAVKLMSAEDGETMEERIASVLKEFPELKAKEKPKLPDDIGGETGSTTPSKKTALLSAARKGAGLPG